MSGQIDSAPSGTSPKDSSGVLRKNGQQAPPKNAQARAALKRAQRQALVDPVQQDDALRWIPFLPVTVGREPIQSQLTCANRYYFGFRRAGQKVAKKHTTNASSYMGRAPSIAIKTYVLIRVQHSAPTTKCPPPRSLPHHIAKRLLHSVDTTMSNLKCRCAS